MQTNQPHNYIAEIDSPKTQALAITINNSDATLTQLHICLSLVYEAIETDCGVTDLKEALYAAIKTRGQ